MRNEIVLERPRIGRRNFLRRSLALSGLGLAGLAGVGRGQPAFLPDRYQQARRGKYFIATNPTPGTGIAMGIQTAFSDTANVLLLCQTPGVPLYPDFLRLICTAAGASTTSSNLVIVTDAGARYGSGGTALNKANALEANAQASGAGVVFGAVTASGATGAKRVVGRQLLKTQAAPCWVVGDQVFIKFGGASGAAVTPGDGATPKIFSFEAPPVIVSGTGSLLFHMWNPGNATTPPSWEVEFGYWEE